MVQNTFMNELVHKAILMCRCIWRGTFLNCKHESELGHSRRGTVDNCNVSVYFERSFLELSVMVQNTFMNELVWAVAMTFKRGEASEGLSLKLYLGRIPLECCEV